LIIFLILCNTKQVSVLLVPKLHKKNHLIMNFRKYLYNFNINLSPEIFIDSDLYPNIFGISV